ncbi:MAG: tungsten formylmethanofuran dehydrogenase [Candidatus Marinimicrobia bacterium]|nr:tungsten formylmethanofuran dehydrogenase [Candidatus Neomarinimicrobiota bacterium]
MKKFSKKELLEIYEKMYLSRKLDDRQLILLKQGKGFFHIGASGHEAAQIAASKFIDCKIDYSYPYYRNQAYCIGLGMTSREILLSFLAKKDDPNSGGRQMPQHFSHPDLNIVSQSSPTGTQYLQAVGASFVLKKRKNGSVSYVTSGEGTTSQGDFHEALNWASREKAPIVFHIENNNYAISVPIEDQVSGSSVFNVASGYESLSRYEIDGCDFFESYLAFSKAFERTRNGKGPSLIVSNVVRLLPHSSSDDHSKYRSSEDIEKDKKRDPLKLFAERVSKKHKVEIREFDKVESLVDKEIEASLAWAEQQEDPCRKSYDSHLFSSDWSMPKSNKLSYISDKVVMVDAINHAMAEELSYNKKMVVYGQDIAGGKGGVFTATRDLTKRFGEDRVFNSPLAESSILGTAIGMSTLGYKPVVEIQFGDYIWTAMMQIRNELATLRYRSDGKWSCPVVVRVPVGGYIHGSLCHSQSIDGYFSHLPGIVLMFPSNAYDAKTMLKSACRLKDPVIFLEHKGLYRQGYASTKEPDENQFAEIGKGVLALEGEDVTIVAWGAMVQKSLEAASKSDFSVEVIDIRYLYPLDFELIVKSVKKTNRVIIVHEDNINNGFGAEIAARISDTCFEYLDAPIKRVASKNYPIPYASSLESEVLVQTEWIYDTINDILNY